MKDNVYNLYEYLFAKKVTEEIPEILKLLDDMQSKLYVYREYRDIANIIASMNEAKLMLQLHLDVYKPIADKKGKRNGKEEK